ncbi:S41 family peptidase [Novosphingobium sp.]|uniref:S41 family peptidase n=1 Tax=Novosphingobium sp. TaxID=1874826 RepID=UPI0025D53BFC|nr:S41 family peptidase [Novosphingobium sp.]MCC6926083.1 hypothetical protein [Novosphingobium sp.]
MIALAGPSPAIGSGQISPEHIKADLELAVKTILLRHPDLSHSTSRKAIEGQARRIARQIKGPTDQAGAWSLLAQLNPVLADGHLFIGFPAWRDRDRVPIAAEGGFFPFEIALDSNGSPTILAELGGAQSTLAGKRIQSINGVDAGSVAHALMARAHGDSTAFRRALTGERWWLFYALRFGQPRVFSLKLRGEHRPRTVLPSSSAAANLQRESQFEQAYSCQQTKPGTVLLKLGSFAWDDKARYLAFTRECFSRIRTWGSKRLVIDISSNGGGDDEFWKEGVLRYLAKAPYRHGSTYRKRQPDGSIAHGEIDIPATSEETEPLRFPGCVTVKIGLQTYSSAVLFANVIRAEKLGSVTGLGGAVRTRQSGGVQSMTLPHTGLVLFYPRFVVDTPDKGTAPSWLRSSFQPCKPTNDQASVRRPG